MRRVRAIFGQMFLMTAALMAFLAVVVVVLPLINPASSWTLIAPLSRRSIFLLMITRNGVSGGYAFCPDFVGVQTIQLGDRGQGLVLKDSFQEGSFTISAAPSGASWGNWNTVRWETSGNASIWTLSFATLWISKTNQLAYPNPPYTTTRFWSLDVSLPLSTTLILLLTPAAVLTVIRVRAIKKDRPPNLCRGCGYDLRGSVESERCPECGSEIDAEQREFLRKTPAVAGAATTTVQK